MSKSRHAQRSRKGWNHHAFVDHDRQSVKGNRQFDELDLASVARIDFSLLDGARGVRDVCLAIAEALESAAGSGHSNSDIHPGGYLGELFRHSLGNQVDGR